jgi:hypothetical protein
MKTSEVSMPNDGPEEPPRSDLVPSSDQNSVLGAWRNLAEEDRLGLIGQLQRLGMSVAQFEFVLQSLPSINTGGGAYAGGDLSVDRGSSVVGRDSIVVNLNLSINDRQTLQQAIPVLAQYPALRNPLYAALRAAEPDLELDFAALGTGCTTNRNADPWGGRARTGCLRAAGPEVLAPPPRLGAIAF